MIKYFIRGYKILCVISKRIISNHLAVYILEHRSKKRKLLDKLMKQKHNMLVKNKRSNIFVVK